MTKKVRLEAAVLKARHHWRKVCASHASTADDRHQAFAAWKKAESTLTKALLLWKNELPRNRRSAAADRRRAKAGTESPAVNPDRRKTVRRP